MAGFFCQLNTNAQIILYRNTCNAQNVLKYFVKAPFSKKSLLLLK